MFNEQDYQRSMATLQQAKEGLSTIRATLSSVAEWEQGHSLLLSTENDAYQTLLLLKRIETNVKTLQGAKV